MAFSNTFQDLYGMKQLPGLASQHLMAQGYGYGGEGDWKVAAMTTIMKAMGEGGNGASAFMEDYTRIKSQLAACSGNTPVCLKFMGLTLKVR